MENQWDHFQQDLFKKANHRMVNLANFYPSLEEKQKFHQAQKFQRLRGAEGQHLQLRNQRGKKLTMICYGYTGSQRGDFHGQITKNFKEGEITIF